jgi:hypothetical protein
MASTIALLAVVIGAILRAATGWPLAGWLMVGALLSYLALEGGATRRGSRVILLLASLAAAAALVWHAAPLPLLVRAATEAGAIIGLFVALGFLRQAAETSVLVQRCGELMVRQPPGRRYLVLSLGSHLISVVLNFGVLPLLGTMVTKGNTAEAAGGDSRIVAIRKQRMLSAILRGFAVMTAWSPLSVSFAVTQNAIAGIVWWQLLPLQLALAAMLLGLGWRLDRLAFPPAANLPGIGGPTDWTPLGQMAALVAGVVAASIVIAEAFGLRLVIGAMIVVPPAALVWLSIQHRSVAAAAGQFGRRLVLALPAFRDEVAMISGAMFLGTVVAAFVSPAAMAQGLAMLGLPPALLMVLLAWAVMALAQIGVSQIISVTLLGGAMAELGGLGISPLALASGLMGAWALSACSTPVGAAVLTIARIGEVPVGTVTRDWNARFVLAGAILLALWLLLLSAALDGY